MFPGASKVRNDVIRIGGWCAYASGWIATVGVVCFVARFGPWKGPFGWINDVSSLLQYLLAIPIALSLYEILRSRHRALAALTTVVGVGGMLATVTLQFALLAGVLTFAEQGGPVSIAILVIGVWLIATGYLLRRLGSFRRSLVMSLLAVPYFGYPIWAFWIGRRLRTTALAIERGGTV